MVADNPCPVVDNLVLVLAFQQRAVAAVDAQTIADAAEGAGANNIAGVFITRVAEAADEVTRLAGSEVGTQIKAGNADITRRSCAHTIGNHIDVILHKAKAEVGEQARVQGVIKT